MSCTKLLTTQAYIDDELDAAAALAAERHIETCAECAALRAEGLAIRKALREQASYHRAPEKLRAAVRQKIGDPVSSPSVAKGGFGALAKPGRSFFAGAGFGAALALAASLLIFVLGAPVRDEMANDVVAAHIRSLIGTHLVDVASNDHHTVKPWFAGHSDVSPPVGDFAKAGFTLVGGRVDYVDGRRAAVTVYRHGAHVMNVFAWKDLGDVKPGTRLRNGYRLLSWEKHGLFFCAVSDTGQSELVRLSQLIQSSDRATE
ncbi:MAG: anti-sigma factor [Proteobacteria bacterium]|nr:anti-sigma factor [Pseudomonadota bacterium]